MQMREEDIDTATEGQTDTETLSSGCRSERRLPELETPGRGPGRDGDSGHLSSAPMYTHAEHTPTRLRLRVLTHAATRHTGAHREGQHDQFMRLLFT